MSARDLCDPAGDAADASEAAEVRVPPAGTSPYSTGGGGFTLERRVAVRYLALLLKGRGAAELGDGRVVANVAFQQAPEWAVDDLVISAARAGEVEPSMSLMLAVRRAPKLTARNAKARELVRQFVRAAAQQSDSETECRWGLVVAGEQTHAAELKKLADLAQAQMDSARFYELIETPRKFRKGVVQRLDHLRRLVKRALEDLGAENPDDGLIRQRTWELLCGLEVLMPRFESPDETDWAAVLNDLTGVAAGLDLDGASRLRDRLVELASSYSPKAASIDRKLLRRDTHAALDRESRHHADAWQRLDDLDHRARSSVRDSIQTDDRVVRLDRSDAVAGLSDALTSAQAVVVSGESGVGKSALAVLSISAAADAGTTQVLCINLRRVPALMIEFESALGCPLGTLLAEISEPQRVLVIDGAEAAAEGSQDTLCGLLDAALANDVKIVLVVANETKQAVRDRLVERFGNDVAEYAVAALTDSELGQIIETFPELGDLYESSRSRDLLRRPVVVDLLVRSGVHGTPLTEADAMNEVWHGLVRRRGVSDRGNPDARVHALLRLADRDLRGSDPLTALGQVDHAAVAGLRRDGILTSSESDQFAIGPGFAHDELRRYAIARLLLGSGDIASTLNEMGAPRWSLSAVRLACQASLAATDTPEHPATGRFDRMQTSFDSLVDAGHGRRWADAPGEALLTLADPSVVLADAWDYLRSDDSVGLRRLARLVDQRLRDANGLVGVSSVEPIIALLLRDNAPWEAGSFVEGLLRDWLHGLIFSRTAAGYPLRVRLRELLVENCAAGERRLAERQQAQAAARARRTPEQAEQDRLLLQRNRHLLTEIGRGGPEPRQRPQVSEEITNKTVVELLALVGPDLGDDGASILRRVARDAPARLAPALEEFLTDWALSAFGRGLLAELTEAYYIDSDYGDAVPLNSMWDGVRRHRARRSSLFELCGPHRGPFMALLQADFRAGVAVLNRLLNHAARVQARILARSGQDPWISPVESDLDPSQIELDIAGESRLYVGDTHVWRWRSGGWVANGPYPCISALQALEIVCDQLLESGAAIDQIVSTLLSGCENIAVASVSYGLLVRHLESAGRLLDPFLVQPTIWHFEFSRCAGEAPNRPVGSGDLVAAERRSWTPREVVMALVLGADGSRMAELRDLGDRLLDNATREIRAARPADRSADDPEANRLIEEELAAAKAWASLFDRDTYRAELKQDALFIRAEPPAEVAAALQGTAAERERMEEESRLLLRYDERLGDEDISSLTAADLSSDLETARRLLEQPSSVGLRSPMDAPALVAAAALEAHLTRNIDISEEDVTFAAEMVPGVIDDTDSRQHFEFVGSFFEQGADLSAARALPLLLLPDAAPLLARLQDRTGAMNQGRMVQVGLNLARSVPDEVRMRLARGLDHLWAAPCATRGRCHHEDGWLLATETMRDCVLGDWIPGSDSRQIEILDDPLDESLAGIDGDSIQFMRLDAAIRALAPAAAASICISDQAGKLLPTLLSAQRRAMLSYACNGSGEGNVVIISGDIDERSTHTLVAARALLTLDRDGRDAALSDFLDDYADSPRLLAKLVTAISAAGEESPERAAAAREVWPTLTRRVLELRSAGHDLSGDWRSGDSVLDALIPTPATTVHFLYRETESEPIHWWQPLTLRVEIEELLATGDTSPWCPNRLIEFLQAVDTDDQARLGLPWIQPLVSADPDNVCTYSPLLRRWLPEIQHAAATVGLQNVWQAIVDDLVVVGDIELAPYSE